MPGRAEERLPALPQFLQRKLYKTGQTRGADDDQIYQNRVLRNSTALIPYSAWGTCRPDVVGEPYENGYIVLISPTDYFGRPNPAARLAADGLELGRNSLVFYESRAQWVAHNPEDLGWTPATARSAPLGGQYVARVAATTAANAGGRIVRGFRDTHMKGAGIRVYEYASSDTIAACRLQLEAAVWSCDDAVAVATSNGMTADAAEARRAAVLRQSADAGLLDLDQLSAARIVNPQGTTICPLCLEPLSSSGFFSRLAQAAGREVFDLTVTELNLFHIEELRVGSYHHRPYNVGWGHHHCNVVAKDAGIDETIKWMRSVVDRNLGLAE